MEEWRGRYTLKSKQIKEGLFYIERRAYSHCANEALYLYIGRDKSTGEYVFYKIIDIDGKFDSSDYILDNAVAQDKIIRTAVDVYFSLPSESRFKCCKSLKYFFSTPYPDMSVDLSRLIKWYIKVAMMYNLSIKPTILGGVDEEGKLKVGVDKIYISSKDLRIGVAYSILPNAVLNSPDWYMWRSYFIYLGRDSKTNNFMFLNSKFMDRNTHDIDWTYIKKTYLTSVKTCKKFYKSSETVRILSEDEIKKKFRTFR